jgi:DNA-binding CsgD family transcriptional regulator
LLVFAEDFLDADKIAVKTLSILERLAHDVRRESPDAINLMVREGCAEDIPFCHALHESFCLPYGEACPDALVEMWRALLSNGSMRLSLVEDRAKPIGLRIISFAATIFVSDEFCCEVRSTRPPYLGVEITRCYLSRELPVLSREQVALANAQDGLNVMMCFGGWKRDGMSREQIVAIRERQFEAFYLAHNGYRLKEIFAEAIGQEAFQWMLDAGARLRRDYSRYFEKHASPIPEISRRPWLVGLTKEEALANPGSHLSSLFVYTPPRFHFNPSEQALLHHALLGKTSEDLAALLFISPWTVKKRWHAIYDRVADVDGDLLPSPIAYGVHASSRGAERRRQLLNYLRQHLEELRPFEPPQRRGTGRTLFSTIKMFVAGAAFFGPDCLPYLCECFV